MEDCKVPSYCVLEPPLYLAESWLVTPCLEVCQRSPAGCFLFEPPKQKKKTVDILSLNLRLGPWHCSKCGDRDTNNFGSNLSLCLVCCRKAANKRYQEKHRNVPTERTMNCAECGAEFIRPIKSRTTCCPQHQQRKYRK